jgi:beta-1,4-mannosyltransferase
VIRHPHYRHLFASPIFLTADNANGIALINFGMIRRYKNVPQLVEAFREAKVPDLTLRVLGRSLDAGLTEEIVGAAAGATGVTLDIRGTMVPDAELEAAVDNSNGVVLAYRNILNSGAALFALSRNRPVLAPRIGCFVELQEQVGADWLQLYDDDISPAAIEHFAQFVRELPPGRECDLSQFDWDVISAQISDFLRTLTVQKRV